MIGKGGAVLKTAGTQRAPGARGAARHPRVPGDAGQGRPRLAAPRPGPRPPRIRPFLSAAEAPIRATSCCAEAAHVECRVPAGDDRDGPRAATGRGHGRRRGGNRGLTHRPRPSPCCWSPRRSSPAAPRSGRTTGRTRSSPRAPTPRRSTTSSCRSSIVAIVIGIFIFVGGRVLRDPVPPPRRATRTRSRSTATPALEIGWTIVPALILAVIAVPTVSRIFELAENPGPNALEVTVVGKQWWWEFDYPASKGTRRSSPPTSSSSPPAARSASTLTACDASLPGGCNVIHSFWVPELAGRRDVVPGHDNHAHDRRPTSRARTSGSAPSTAGSRTPTCASG